MPRIVDHNRRKTAILFHALGLFEEQGLADTTLTQIAQRCKIGRPTLYQYFRNKDEIFQFSIKYYTDNMFQRYQKISTRKIPVMQRLREIFGSLANTMASERFFLRSLVNYYAALCVAGREKEFLAGIRRRTILFRRLLLKLMQEAEQNGEIPPGRARDVEILMVLSQNIFFQVGVFERQYDRIIEQLIESALLGMTQSFSPFSAG